MLPCSIFFLLSYICLSSVSVARGAEYTIKTTWNNLTTSHPNNLVSVQLDKQDAESFKVIVKAPFFDDPAPSGPTPAGESLFGLWDFELIKILIANNDNQYLEIELGAWGHHFVLLLNGYRQTIQFGMVIDYNASRTKDTWEGKAVIPVSYLPPRVTKMNIFAYHGSSDKRITEALYPVAFDPAATLDDHKLETFHSFDAKIIRDDDPSHYSVIWTYALEGARILQIKHTWDGKRLPANEMVDLSLSVDVSTSNLILNVSVPFYNDLKPDRPGGGPYIDLWKKHEVVHLYLLSWPDLKYLEIELAPWGHYLIAFWNGYYNHIGSFESPIKYLVNRTDSRWSGTAAIPLSYLPPKVYLVNAFSGHGNESNRQSNALYPIPGGGNRTHPDYHLFQYYKFFDLSMLYPDNDSPVCSKIWQGITTCTNSASDIFIDKILLLVISFLFIAIY